MHTPCSVPLAREGRVQKKEMQQAELVVICSPAAQDSNITLRNSHAEIISYLSAYTVSDTNTSLLADRDISLTKSYSSLLNTNTMDVHDIVTSVLPLPLGGKAKHIHANYSHRANTSSFLVGPDAYSGPVTLIGKGSYGYAVKCTKILSTTGMSPGQSTDSHTYTSLSASQDEVALSGLPIIMKVDHEHKHLAWEVVIHSKVCLFYEQLYNCKC
jgi:hypothetical protein